MQAFPLSDVQAFMGHADIATMMIYVHQVPQHDAAGRLVAASAQGATVVEAVPLQRRIEQPEVAFGASGGSG